MNIKKGIICLSFLALIGLTNSGIAQTQTAQTGSPEIDYWIYNDNGHIAINLENGGGGPGSIVVTSIGDSSNVLQICFDNDFVWIRADDLADTMGVQATPNSPEPQNMVKKFPRNPVAAVEGSETSTKGVLGFLLNGVNIDAQGDNHSYNDDDVWNGDVGLSEISTLDSRYNGHAGGDSRYHTHAIPYYLDDTPSNEHSNLVGFAYDGFPIYGTKGYVDPLDMNSGVTRMISGYELRNITVRDSLPEVNGAIGNPAMHGPDVDASFPIGTYIEDFAYTATDGTLDEHNGRFCKTPEYPNGTYAYFCSTDAAGEPMFPYMVGTQYYGVPETENIGPTSDVSLPTSGCYTGSTVSINDNNELALGEVKVYPNPTNGMLNIEIPSTDESVQVRVLNLSGQKVYSENGTSGSTMQLNFATYVPGIYFLEVQSGEETYQTKIVIK